MSLACLSIFLAVIAVLAPACLATERAQAAVAHSTIKKTIAPCPYPPQYATRTTETGATERILLPCPTPDPCIWPRPHTVSRLSIPYPPRCCPILYRKLSARTIAPYPLPYPCKTPIPLPKKPECAPCRSGSECLQGKCWGSPLKCTDGDYHGLLRCGYKKECEACTSGLQCATMKCWKSKCVFDTKESKQKCFH